MPALPTVLRLNLMLVLVMSTQSYLAIETAFLLDRDDVAARYCVNRDRPELNCNGACELTRRLQEQHDREQEQQSALLEVALSLTMWLPSAATIEAPPRGPAGTIPRPGDAHGARGAPDDVFRPPRAA